MSLDSAIQATKTYYCLECGKCTSLCPVARHDPSFSPRAIVEMALLGLEDELIFNRELFSCLTCYTCSQKCPADVDFPVFVRQARAVAQNSGEHGTCAHSGQMQALARMMTTPGIKQRRLEWLSDRFQVSDESDILLWVGCAPYFEPLFEDIEFRALDITEATLTVLNALGIQPRLLADEKCCGHDALWMGDEETFKKLAEHNAALIKDSGVKKIIFSCPEGYRTLKLDYPAYGLALDCELQHISEFLAERIEQGDLKLGRVDKKVSYQDPCRLGRHLGIYDAPRKVLQAIPGIELVEMEHCRENSICCGTSAFTNCDSYSNDIRKERLAEAASTDAEAIVTSCPKCQTHFRCAMVDKGEEKRSVPQLDVVDLVNLVAESLRGAES